MAEQSNLVFVTGKKQGGDSFWEVTGAKCMACVYTSGLHANLNILSFGVYGRDFLCSPVHFTHSIKSGVKSSLWIGQVGRVE